MNHFTRLSLENIDRERDEAIRASIQVCEAWDEEAEYDNYVNAKIEYERYIEEHFSSERSEPRI